MSLWNDLRLAVRGLARDRAYACIAILTLGFGLAANTIIFSIVDGVLLRPLRYREPGRLVVVNEVVTELAKMYPRLPVAARHYLEWRDRAISFERIAIMEPRRSILTGGGEPEQLDTARVSANLLPLLGVSPQIGRNFTQDEDQPGHDNVVVISDGLWSRRFARDPAVVGRTVTLDGVTAIVVGVLPASFRLPDSEPGQLVHVARRVDIYKPFAIRVDRLNWFGPFNYAAIGRLKPGVSIRQAVSELNVLQEAIAARIPDKVHLRVELTDLHEEVTSSSRAPLLILLGAVAVVLLIVCVNLANLALARGAARSRDLAVRRALGATRWQLVRTVLVEAGCVSLAGAAAGIVSARFGLAAILSRAPFDIPRLDEIHLDARVLVFTLGLALLSAILFGALPAWRAAAIDPQRTLRDGSRATEGRTGRFTRNLLVAVECGLGATLLIVAGLLTVSLVHLLNADRGFNAERTLTAKLTASPTRYADSTARHAYYRNVLDRLREVPAVTDAAMISQLPLSGEDWVDVIRKAGDKRPFTELPPANYRFCSPDYFRIMGVRFVRGTGFTEADRNRNLAVMSEAAVRVAWPGENAVGKKFNSGDNTDPAVEVAGVVRDVAVAPTSKPVPTVYLPYWSENESTHSMNVVVRTAADPRAAARSLSKAVWSVDREVVVGEIQTIDDVVSNSVGGRRFEALLIGGFAAAALLLACLGIYGVVSWTVARRRNEIGIRMALGAADRDVRRMVVWQGMKPVLAGLALGLAGAFALGRILASLLFGVTARDPVIIGGTVLALAAVGVLACYLPARRATAADPLLALRYE